jgi:hypothetical protein
MTARSNAVWLPLTLLSIVPVASESPSALSLIPSLSSTVSPSSDGSSPTSSGEFLPYSVVGASLAGGGGES